MRMEMNAGVFGRLGFHSRPHATFPPRLRRARRRLFCRGEAAPADAGFHGAVRAHRAVQAGALCAGDPAGARLSSGEMGCRRRHELRHEIPFRAQRRGLVESLWLVGEGGAPGRGQPDVRRPRAGRVEGSPARRLRVWQGVRGRLWPLGESAAGRGGGDRQ